jgi:hypothetical protein
MIWHSTVCGQRGAAVVPKIHKNKKIDRKTKISERLFHMQSAHPITLFIYNLHCVIKKYITL